MTLYEVITEADNLRPNAIDDEMKARWVMQLEVEYAELMDVDVPELLFPDDQTLLMPSPHDYSYVYYLNACIDNHNQDTALYNNDHAMSNAAVDDAKSYYRRHNVYCIHVISRCKYSQYFRREQHHKATSQAHSY